MNFKQHDWFIAVVSIIVAVVTSLLIYAYSQGTLDHRVETLEKQVVQLRDLIVDMLKEKK
jgi:hypothetical protein